jgi:maltokinase
LTSAEDFRSLLAPFVGRQRWFAGEPPKQVHVQDFEMLREAWPRLAWMLIEVNGHHYQLLAGGRPLGEHAGFLDGHESAVLGEADGGYWYDAAFDPELAVDLLRRVSDGAENAERVRVMGVEQSNTSLVYDDRLILKIFRRVQPGRNPDVEITTALAREGFTHVATPVASWQRDGYDLVFVQRFLAGGSEGWALALTSLRDLLAGGPDDPAEAGGDFASEADRLGQVTAEMHIGLADSFGTETGDGARWADALDGVVARLDPAERAGAAEVARRLREVRSPGPATRVHGDYHLGQVMRTDEGWFVLDFEGEPARSLDQRRAHVSPMKDVTGMLRSFDYAAQSVLRERAGSPADFEALTPLAEAWRDRNREAFLTGYTQTEGIQRLLPGDATSFQRVLDAFELDKAIYELGYEEAYRPDWVEIPRGAIARLAAHVDAG